jgi:GH15 family glucan-1,4-alpha-glucosidase
MLRGQLRRALVNACDEAANASGLLTYHLWDEKGEQRGVAKCIFSHASTIFSNQQLFVGFADNCF